MDNPHESSDDAPRKGKKIRIDLRRNRSKPKRVKNWTEQAMQAEDMDIETAAYETSSTRSDLTRKRTIIVDDDGERRMNHLPLGTVVAITGLYAEVDDGTRIIPCTVRRMLRTTLSKERQLIAVGDRVRVNLTEKTTDDGLVIEGVIEHVEPRISRLVRVSGKRQHTIAANVEQVIIVSSVVDPPPKPHLIDRYIVAALAGSMTPVVCFNKIDLLEDGSGSRGAIENASDDEDETCAYEELVALYGSLGYRSVAVSAETGVGMEELRSILRDKSSVVAGQSGVGKSSLLNAVQAGLALKTGAVMAHLGKGRHTTTHARLIKLAMGGYVVDTPGIRTLDLTTMEREQIEALFVEFLPYIPDCKFADCTHRHEESCAVKGGVEAGKIHPMRYGSYVRMYEEMGLEG